MRGWLKNVAWGIGYSVAVLIFCGIVAGIVDVSREVHNSYGHSMGNIFDLTAVVLGMGIVLGTIMNAVLGDED